MTEVMNDRLKRAWRWLTGAPSPELERTEELSAIIQDPNRSRHDQTGAFIEMFGDCLTASTIEMLWSDARKQDDRRSRSHE